MKTSAHVVVIEPIAALRNRGVGDLPEVTALCGLALAEIRRYSSPMACRA